MRRSERIVGWLDRRASLLRVLLLGLAAVLLVLGWLVGPFVPADDWGVLARNFELFQKLAAVPAAAWALLDALRQYLTDRRGDDAEAAAQFEASVQAQFETVLIELEEACVREGVSARTYHCGVTVWQLQPLTERDAEAAEKRRRLRTAAIRPPRYRRATSGLRWREGMGVIGMAVQRNDKLAINVDEVWRPLRGCSEETWNALNDEFTTQGLKHEEFLRAVNGTPGSLEPAGQFVMAVPVWRGDEPLGVVALDTPPEMAGAAQDSRLQDLLYAIGVFVLMPGEE